MSTPVKIADIGTIKMESIVARLAAVKDGLEGAVWDNCSGGTTDDGIEYLEVHQGSHLGDTLICLDDEYEGSGIHCLFLQSAYSDIQFLIEQIEFRDRQIETLKAANAKAISATIKTKSGDVTQDNEHDMIRFTVDGVMYVESRYIVTGNDIMSLVGYTFDTHDLRFTHSQHIVIYPDNVIHLTNWKSFVTSKKEGK